MGMQGAGWRLLAGALMFVGVVVALGMYGSLPPAAIFGALSLYGLAAVALGLTLLLRASHADASDVAAAAALAGTAILADATAFSGLLIIGLAVALFAVLAAVRTWAMDAETGRRWPSLAGWRLFLWIAALSFVLMVFGLGLQAAGAGISVVDSMQHVLAVGFAGVPATRRLPGSIRGTVGGIATGTVLGAFSVLLGEAVLPASLIGLQAGLLVWCLIASFLDRIDADPRPRPAQSALRQAPIGILIALLAAGVVLASAVGRGA